MTETIKHKCTCNRVEFQIKMAFQPIIDVNEKQVVSYEALVRDIDGGSAYQVLKRVNDENKYSFDQQCRVVAIETFSALNTDCNININFMPQAIYEPQACLAKTLQTAKRCNFDTKRIIFEVTEQEQVVSKDFLINIFTTYREHGFQTAIDDFGEGFAGLNLLSGFQPNFIKLDMMLIRDIDKHPAKQAIFDGVKLMCDRLNIVLLAEGVETRAEYLYLKEQGIALMQGYYFAKPEIEALPEVAWDNL